MLGILFSRGMGVYRGEGLGEKGQDVPSEVTSQHLMHLKQT